MRLLVVFGRGRGGGRVTTFASILAKARESDVYWIEGAKIDFTEEFCREMHQQNISRAELARRMEVSDAYITKLLRGTTNFTLATMVRAARAIDREVRIHLTSPGHRVHWFDIVSPVQVPTSDIITITRELQDAERADESVAA